MSDRYTVIHPDTLEAMRRAGYVAKLEARIEKLEALLHDASEFLDNYSDVIDGLDGQPEANDAMILKQEIDRVLENKHD